MNVFLVCSKILPHMFCTESISTNLYDIGNVLLVDDFTTISIVLLRNSVRKAYELMVHLTFSSGQSSVSQNLVFVSQFGKQFKPCAPFCFFSFLCLSCKCGMSLWNFTNFGPICVSFLKCQIYWVSTTFCQFIIFVQSKFVEITFCLWYPASTEET